MRVPAAIRDAWTPVFRARVDIGTVVSRGLLYSAGPPEYLTMYQLSLVVDGGSPYCVNACEVAPVNAAARRLLRSSASRGPRKA